jgi:hypothetical protein
MSLGHIIFQRLDFLPLAQLFAFISREDWGRSEDW